MIKTIRGKIELSNNDNLEYHFQKYSYFKAIQHKVCEEFTHLVLADPPNEYPRINFKPYKQTTNKVKLIDYEIEFKNTNTPAVYEYFVYLTPNEYTFATINFCIKHGIITAELFYKKDFSDIEHEIIKDFLLENEKC